MSAEPVSLSSSSSPIASSSNTHSHITHLSYPAPSPPAPSPPPIVPKESLLLKKRLYVGNLHPSVDEYAFLQIFSKYGKISNLDFLFYKNGPLKGRTRGYAFVEFTDEDSASRALSGTNDKVLRGRKLVVTFAHQASSPIDMTTASGSGQQKYRKWNSETNKPTALSLIKSSSSSTRTKKTADKIAALEAKLQEMQDVSQSSSSTPAHPSLPQKPPAFVDLGSSGIRQTTSKLKTLQSKSNAINPLGKKPTLEELMRSNQKMKTGILTKR